MESLNRAAVELVDEAIDFADELGIAVHHLENDAVVLDFGVEATGGLEAGLLLAEMGTGGLASLDIRLEERAGGVRPVVELSTDHPALSLLAAHPSMWPLDPAGFDGRGGGPAQLRRGAAERVGVPYEEDFDLTVLTVESTTLPGPDVARYVAEETGVPTSGVYLPTAPIGSLVGSVAMAARTAEVALLRLETLGIDATAVRSITADAPVAPVATDERTAIARTNDALAYGGRAHIVAEDAPPDPTALIFGSSDPEGPFADIFPEVEWDLDALGPDTFAPAEVTLDVVGGETHSVGRLDETALIESFGG